MKYFKKLSIALSIAIVVLGVFSAHASAAQYYVDSSSTASTANGSLSAPWKTLSNVTSAALQPGDIVSFKRGTTYTGTATFNRSGTAAAPITFNTYGTAAEGPKFIGTGGSVENLFYFPTSTAYLVFDGFYFTDPTLNASDPNHAEMAKNKRIFTIDGSHITIKNVIIELSGAPVVFIGPYNVLDRSIIRNLRMVVNTCSSWSGTTCTQVGSGDDQDYGANPVTLLSSSNNTITNNTFSGCWAKSYDYQWDGGAIEFYGAGASNNLIAYNTISDCIGVSEVTGTSGNNIFAYNKFINIASLVYFQADIRGYGATYTNWQYYNNDLVENATNKIFVSQLISGTTQTGSVILKNNVFKLSNGVDVTNTTNGSKLVHANNAYQLSNNSLANITLASNEISTASTLFANTASTDPVYWNFTPATGSPLINAGTSVGFTADATGTSVPQGSAPDIGAHEYTTTTSGDTIAPSVLFTSPVSGSTVSLVVPVGVSASDNVGVVGVQFKLDGVALGTEDTTSPYSVTWSTTGTVNGTHTLTATARDAAGLTATATSVVTVNNVVADTTAPSVAFSSPAAGATVSGTTTITVSASDNVAVANVRMQLDGVDHTIDTTSPYTASWITTGVSAGTHTWTAIATDTAGLTAVTTRSFTVNNTVADTTAPTVAFSSPAAGATVSGNTAVVASASDNVGVASVQFALDGINHTFATVAPYTANWITTGVSNGTHTWTAIARDAAGNISATASRSFTVSNTTSTSIPSVPAGFTATVDTSTQVTLAWAASTGSPVGYEIYRNGVNINHTSNTTYVDSGLTPGMTYTYAVSSYNAAGESAKSTSISINTTSTTTSAMYITTAKVNVRLNPTLGQAGTILGQQYKNTIGTQIPGTSTVNASGYTWIKLDFPTGADGWVTTRYLLPYTSSAGSRTTTTLQTESSPTLKTMTSTSLTSLEILDLLHQISSATTTTEANALLLQMESLQK